MMPGDHGSGEAGTAAVIEAAAAMEGADASTVKRGSTTAKSAAVKCRAATAAEMAATSAMMSTTTTTMSTTTVSASAVSAADLERVRGVFRDRRRCGTNRRKRFRALRGRHHQHRGSRDAQRLRQAAPKTWNLHHA
jgi:hypothetical protein